MVSVAASLAVRSKMEHTEFSPHSLESNIFFKRLVMAGRLVLRELYLVASDGY